MWTQLTIHLLLFTASLVHGECPVAILEETSDFMSDAFCKFYSDSQLAKLNGIHMANNANITIRNFDPLIGECGAPQVIPIRLWLPLMFRQDHDCQALIAVGSSVGDDNLVTISGYVEHRLAMTVSVRDITMVLTQSPATACNLLVQEIRMSDLRCFTTQVSTGTGTGSETTSTSTISTTDTSTTNTSDTNTSSTDNDPTSPLTTTPTSPLTTTPSASTSKTFVTDQDRYNSVTTAGAEFDSDQFQANNPLFGAQRPEANICRFHSGQLRLILGALPRRHAELACMRAGLRLARITEGNLRDAITMAGACLGEGRAAWIKGYWRRVAGSACLEVVAGKTSRSGGINLASDCGRRQAVLCEDPFFQAM